MSPIFAKCKLMNWYTVFSPLTAHDLISAHLSSCLNPWDADMVQKNFSAHIKWNKISFSRVCVHVSNNEPQLEALPIKFLKHVILWFLLKNTVIIPALNPKGTLKQDVPTGSTFEPKGIFRMLNLIKYDSTFKLGKQEDAEEFLSCVLNLLHEEMVAAVKVVEEDRQSGCQYFCFGTLEDLM